MDEASNNDADVFVYMGEGYVGQVVPREVVRARVHPSVTAIPSKHPFNNRVGLEEVDLCEGLLEIKRNAFEGCSKLKRIRIPSTVRIITKYAFSNCLDLEKVELCEGVEEIVDQAFVACRSLTYIKLPSTIRTIGRCAFSKCNGVFSVEFPASSSCRVECGAFRGCSSLRNITIPPNVQVWQNLFHETDLQQLFGGTEEHMYNNDEQLINALKHRFDNLPIHKMIYYQSYNNVTVDQLNEATSIRYSKRRSKINPAGSQQDCLGMTPLHILACSTVQNVELYKVLVNKYPDTLVTKDRWGDVPLFYAVWGRAPKEIVQFLIDSYNSLYPDFEFDWTSMIGTLSKANAPMNTICHIHGMKPYGNAIDWKTIIQDGAVNDSILKVSFQRLVQRSIIKRIESIGLKQWRDEMTDSMTKTICYQTSKKIWLERITTKLDRYEMEYNKLKEATSSIILALWKKKINESESIEQGGESRCSKKPRIDESDHRKQCRVNCRADIVIEHALPFLLPGPCSENDSSSDTESDDDGSESE